MSHYKEIFTDAVKDVIGNEPVLDQFDISYTAQFYGSMQDDFITGSMLSRIGSTQKVAASGKSVSVPVFATGSIPRGRRVSKYYADDEPPLSSVFGSDDVQKVPQLSYRIVPWHNRVSRTAYRIRQCYDSDERFYDTCLPDFAAAIKSNGSQVWTAANSPQFWLSPYGNVVTGNIGYLFFNNLKVDRSAEGFSTDPMSENDWTWSYPYETKYFPEKRVIKTSKSLGLTESFLSTTWGTSIIPPLTQSVKPTQISGFIPFLPGYNDPNELMPYGGRNSYRSFYLASGSLGTLAYLPAENSDERLDSYYGVSYLIPGDVNLKSLASHSYLNSYPAVVKPDPAPITGTMSLDDTVKFLYGFGDKNNLTWSTRLFKSGSSVPHIEYFEIRTGASSGTIPSPNLNKPYNIANYYHSYGTTPAPILQLSWSNSPLTNPWSIYCRQGELVDNNLVLDPTTAKTYNYISASSAAMSLPPAGVATNFTATDAQGLFWEANYRDSFVMMSDSLSYYGAAGAPLYGYSAAVLDITSSTPWKISYDRCVASGNPSLFFTYFAGIPGYPSHLSNSGYGVLALADILTSSIPGISGHAVGVMTNYDSMIHGPNVNVFLSYPIAPGAYRLVFIFEKLFSCTTTPRVAAINNIRVSQFFDFPPDTTAQKLGANNYPTFRTYKVDTRYNPIAAGNYLQVSGTADTYKGDIFGVSPVIRGWKYGLYSGLPMNSKAVFRRDKFGQFRDMLEQRPYTKYVSVGTSPTDNDAITTNNFQKETDPSLTNAKQVSRIGQSAVEVNFVKQRYRKDDRGIGFIYNEKVDPSLTISQNLSTEVTSSVPYFDGIARHRQESDLLAVRDLTTTSLTIDGGKITVT